MDLCLCPTFEHRRFIAYTKHSYKSTKIEQEKILRQLHVIQYRLRMNAFDSVDHRTFVNVDVYMYLLCTVCKIPIVNLKLSTYQFVYFHIYTYIIILICLFGFIVFFFFGLVWFGWKNSDSETESITTISIKFTKKKRINETVPKSSKLRSSVYDWKKYRYRIKFNK